MTKKILVTLLLSLMYGSVFATPMQESADKINRNSSLKKRNDNVIHSSATGFNALVQISQGNEIDHIDPITKRNLKEKLNIDVDNKESVHSFKNLFEALEIRDKFTKNNPIFISDIKALMKILKAQADGSTKSHTPNSGDNDDIAISYKYIFFTRPSNGNPHNEEDELHSAKVSITNFHDLTKKINSSDDPCVMYIDFSRSDSSSNYYNYATYFKDSLDLKYLKSIRVISLLKSLNEDSKSFHQIVTEVNPESLKYSNSEPPAFVVKMNLIDDSPPLSVFLFKTQSEATKFSKIFSRVSSYCKVGQNI